MLQNPLVFFIDDDYDDQEIFTFLLKDIAPGASFIFANDGVHALEKIQSDESFVPHLILIDMNMPRMNGLQFLQEMKKMEHLLHVPAYMFSTSAEPPIVEQCLELGASGFLIKRTNTDDLRRDLSRLINSLK